ncbi:MAG: RNA pyrophosphohydrolase [Pseudomonadota bacterium]|nr:RNA pyrophosphohydrolase [Pseudomonadota bacterium]
MSSSLSGLPYRPCIGIMLINPDWHVFVGQRIDQEVEAWQMPQGGVDDGEDADAAVFREMEEEIGTARAEILGRAPEPIAYDLPEHLVGRVWKGRYRGQSQTWYALRFLGTDADIRIDTAHPEFNAWRWAPLSDLVELAVPFKRDTYRKVVEVFAPLFPEQHR